MYICSMADFFVCGEIGAKIVENRVLTFILMAIFSAQKDNKRGKQNPNVLPHIKDVKVSHEAHRLEGKVKNLGIKNLGHQKKKSSGPK